MIKSIFKNKAPKLSKEGMRCRKKFLYYFPKGFEDKTYKAWERNYKLDAHFKFQEELNREAFEKLLKQGKYEEIALKAVRIETKTNLLFSFEKMALRDAVKPAEGAREFAEGLFQYLYGKGELKERFENFTAVIAALPRKQTRVLTWPLTTVFGFLGNPQEHIFLKPRVTQLAAKEYGFDFQYKSKPNWNTYQSMLAFAAQVKNDNADLNPQDYIDLQSFIWVMGSEEYPW
jgi:hypothetical protein